MRTLKTRPQIDSLHTLNVWTPYGNLMVKCHEVLNGDRCPYVNSQVWTYREGKPRPYTNEEILASLASRGKSTLNLQVDDNRSNRLALKAPVVFAGTVALSDTAWILVFDGILERHANDKETEEQRARTTVKVACYYDTEYGRGFCLLPELARQQLWCNG